MGPLRRTRSSTTMKGLISRAQKVDTTLAMWGQVGTLGDEYDAWVHQPSTQREFRMFESPIMEAGSKSKWWMVLLVWPWFAAFWFASSLQCSSSRETLAGFSCAGDAGLRPATAAIIAGLGVVWVTLFEYVFHRAVFHYPTAGLSEACIKFHFMVHGQHHKFPLDSQRLVFPVVPAAVLVSALYAVFHTLLPFTIARAFSAGAVAGYIKYDMVHYYIHHGPKLGLFSTLRKAHMDHHFRNHDKGFGLSSSIWDIVFRTMHDPDS